MLYAIQNHIFWIVFLGTGGTSLASKASASSLPVTTSTFAVRLFHGVLNQILCPKYNAKKSGSVIYADRKLEAVKEPGKNT